MNNKSLSKAWNRVGQKFNPMTDINYSPVKPISYNLRPKTESFSETRVDGTRLSAFTWLLTMSEQFYYDTTLMLISRYQLETEHLCTIFRMNYSDKKRKRMSNWININVLGQGGFGKVFQIYDKMLDEKFAIKYNKSSHLFGLERLQKNLMIYFQERNYLIRARSSPYMVAFYEAYREKNLLGTFLLLEYCVGDYDNFTKLLRTRSSFDMVKIHETKQPASFKEALKLISLDIGVDLQPFIVIYFYECLCMLDYLAKVNIVHLDIKVKNILISKDGHLKLADFGVVYNTYMVTSDNQIYMHNVNDLEKMENDERYNEPVGIKGTPSYWDLEMLFYAAYHNDEDHLKNYIINETPEMVVDLSEDIHPSFLSDLWAMGIVFLHTFHIGFSYFSDNVDERVKKFLKIHEHTHIMYLINLFTKPGILNGYFKDGLMNLTNNSPYIEFVSFVLSIFKKREERAVEFTQTKTTRTPGGSIVESAYIDIEKLSQINIFKEIQLNPSNCFLYPLDRAFIDALMVCKNIGKKALFPTYGALLKSIRNEEYGGIVKPIEICPGTQVITRMDY